MATDIKLEINELSDGSLCLSCGDKGMESDLVFASGSMSGDPSLEDQREILNYIVSLDTKLKESEEALKKTKKELDYVSDGCEW